MERNINEILGFYFNSKNYEAIGQRSLISNVVRDNIDKIEQACKPLETSYDFVNDDAITTIITLLNKHLKLKHSANSVDITNKQAKILSYHISPSLDDALIKYCIEILDINWSFTMLRGLLHSFMSNWLDFNPDTKKLIRVFIEKHIELDNSRFAKSLKQVKTYLSNPYKLGRMLFLNKKNVLECCDYFHITQNKFNYSYFTPVVVSYFEQSNSIDLDYLKVVLNSHNSKQADKTIISRSIVNMSTHSIPREWINFAIERVGDPTMESYWLPFPFATREEQSNIRKAREILIKIFSSEIINIFFEKLCIDSSRYNFWKKHVNKISDFRIYGTYLTRKILSDYIKEEILSKHFFTIATNTSNSALVMYMGQYALIEFTESGALYVYKVDSTEYQKVFHNKTINKLDNLRCPMNNLIDIYGSYLQMNENGRMIHTGYWTERLNRWINKKI